MNDIPGRHPLVLLRCDEVQDDQAIQDMLYDQKLNYRSMDRGETFEQVCETREPDVILIDLNREIEFVEPLLRMVDALPGGSGLPIILIAPSEILIELMAVVHRFHTVFLIKPLVRDRLISAVQAGLNLRAGQRKYDDILAENTALIEQSTMARSALDQLRGESAEEGRRKTRFLTAISHDLRTPVNALVLSCQLLRAIAQASPTGTIAAHDVDELSEALISNAAALVELLNDLLVIARQDQGQLEFTETNFLLVDLISSTVDGLRPLADQKHLSMSLIVKTPAAMLRTDQSKLARVVQNLVTNAIKFTDSGRIQITAHATTRDGLRLVVEDTGIGIPPALREAIFDEFAQLRNPERDRTKGTGLGLAICRRLVVAMGGTIQVDPEPRPVGSAFSVCLPAARVISDEDPSSHLKSTTFQPGNRYRGEVLVVEDHEPSRTLLRRLLRRVGVTVRTAENGRDALNQISRARPDLVLMDLMMPVMGGREALLLIRSQPTTRNLAVIILTGDINGDENLFQPIEGASAYLRKPVDVPALYGILDRYLTAGTTTAEDLTTDRLPG